MAVDLNHAIGVLSIKGANLIVCYDPNFGESIWNEKYPEIWEKLHTHYANSANSDFGLFRFVPNGMMHGTFAELSALSQITPFVLP